MLACHQLHFFGKQDQRQRVENENVFLGKVPIWSGSNFVWWFKNDLDMHALSTVCVFKEDDQCIPLTIKDKPHNNWHFSYSDQVFSLYMKPVSFLRLWVFSLHMIITSFLRLCEFLSFTCLTSTIWCFSDCEFSVSSQP